MSRSTAFVKNATWSFLLQLVTVASGFIVPRLIIGSYGSGMNGLVSSITQMVGYISLVEAGISAASVYALYKPLAEQDEEQVNIIVSASRKFYNKSGWTFVALGLVMAVVYPLVVDHEGLTPIQVAVLVTSLCASGFLDFFTLAKYRVLLTASQRNWVIQAASIVYRVLYVLVVVVMTKLGVNIVAVYLAAIVPILIRSAILIIYSKKIFPNVDYYADDKGYKLEQRWDAFYLQVLSVVQMGFPILVVTFILRDLKLLSIYSVHMLAANGIQNLCATITNGTQASFGDVIARDDKKTLRRSYFELSSMMGIINTTAAGAIAVMIVPFVMIYTKGVTDANYYRPILGTLVMANAFLYHLKTPEGLLVIAAGKYREVRPFVVAQAVILAIGAIIGALAAGVEGMVVGSCMSNLYAAAYLSRFVPKHITYSERMRTVRRHALSILAFVPAAVVSVLQLEMMPQNWLGWLIETAVIAVCILIWSFVIFFLFERESTMGALTRFRGMLMH